MCRLEDNKRCIGDEDGFSLPAAWNSKENPEADDNDYLREQGCAETHCALVEDACGSNIAISSHKSSNPDRCRVCHGYNGVHTIVDDGHNGNGGGSAVEEIDDVRNGTGE